MLQQRVLVKICAYSLVVCSVCYAQVYHGSVQSSIKVSLGRSIGIFWQREGNRPMQDCCESSCTYVHRKRWCKSSHFPVGASLMRTCQWRGRKRQNLALMRWARFVCSTLLPNVVFMLMKSWIRLLRGQNKKLFMILWFSLEVVARTYVIIYSSSRFSQHLLRFGIVI